MNIFKNKHTLPTILLTIAFGVMTWLIIKVVGNWPWNNSSDINWDKGSKFGDLVGGILSFLSILFLYFTIRNQLFSYEKTQFESKFFQMLNFHRENVSRFEYKNPGSEKGDIVTGDKVLLLVFREIQGINKEINKYYSKIGFPDEKMYLNEKPQLKSFYERVKGERPNIPWGNLLILDIAYLIVYFGLSDESQSPLEIAINSRYKYKDFQSLITHLKSKTAKWDEIERSKSIKRLEEKGYNYKYYGGHQIRLGHYFRHLYQLVHFVNKQTFLSFEEKYDYIKTLRAQLSTYEQAILWYNSLSSLGYKWEYMADDSDSFSKDYRKSLNNELITKYNLVKNLPQGIIQTFGVQMFYPNVEFESFDYQKQETKRGDYIKKVYS